MAGQPSIAISHFGVCVSDLERSKRFYIEALGFESEYELEFGAPFEVLTELPPIQARAAFLRRDGVRIELASYASPGVIGPAERRPMNQLGLTHMALVVDDLDAVARRIAEAGGQVLPQTRVETPSGDLIFCTDPDGVRFELWRKPARRADAPR